MNNYSMEITVDIDSPIFIGKLKKIIRIFEYWHNNCFYYWL